MEILKDRYESVDNSLSRLGESLEKIKREDLQEAYEGIFG